MQSRVFERFLHCTRVFTVCCAGARRHLSEEGLSELVPYPRAQSLHCPAFSPDVCGARFGLHVVFSCALNVDVAKFHRTDLAFFRALK